MSGIPIVFSCFGREKSRLLVVKSKEFRASRSVKINTILFKCVVDFLRLEAYLKSRVN